MTTPTSPTPKIWLITGASSGLGLAITLSALHAGHRVIACARNPHVAAEVHPEVERLGGKWLKLDVTSPDTQNIVKSAVEEAGGIDVVVNNAGYMLAGAIEDITIEELHSLMTTNFYGPIRVLKGVLPTLRAQRSGTIVSMSSILGFRPSPGCSAYNASKSALEGLTETLALDLKPFNIRCVILEPGLFRTGVLAAAPMPGAVGKDYLESTVGAAFELVGKMIERPEEFVPGEPGRLGERVVEFVDGTGMGEGLGKHMRLLLGRDAVELAGEKMRVLRGDFEACEGMARSTDFEGCTAEGVSGVLAF